MKEVNVLTWVKLLDQVQERSSMSAETRQGLMDLVFSVPVPSGVTERAQYRLGVLVGLLQPWVESLSEEEYHKVVQLEGR